MLYLPIWLLQKHFWLILWNSDNYNDFHIGIFLFIFLFHYILWLLSVLLIQLVYFPNISLYITYITYVYNNVVSVSPWLPGWVAQVLLSKLAELPIHLLATTFLPSRTGQPPWSIARSQLPSRLMLSHNTADPGLGRAQTPSRGKTVRPPARTEER